MTSLQKKQSLDWKMGWNMISSRDYVTGTQVSNVQVTFSER